MPFATSLALALSLALTGPASLQTSAPASMPAAQSVEQYVKIYFADEPIMIDIARCESQYTQFDKDGSVHRGVVNNKDVGVMQVNEYYHGTTAQKLGLDLYTIQGNVAYARYLYSKEGAQPWSSSAPCWDKAGKILARK
jgi:hypothetical protein